MLVLSPLLVPLFTAVITVLLQRHQRIQQVFSIAGAAMLLLCSLLLVQQVDGEGRISVALGDWPLPFAIELVADRLSALMVVITAVLGLGVLVYQTSIGVAADESAMLHPLLHGLLAAVGGSLLTADLFNLYVWFELMLITVLGLLVLHDGFRHQEAAFKYFALNMFGTLLFLAAVAMLYGTTGQLNFSGLAEAVERPELKAVIPVYVAMLMSAFLLKAAAFPLFFWLPASYHTLPAPVLALIGGLITKVGVYVLLRLTGEVFVDQPAVFYEALGWIAVATMVSGVLGAAYHWDLRRILAFHIVSQIGYLLLAVALATPAGGSAGVFFMVHNILAKAALFLIAGIMWRTAGHYDLRRIGGLYPARPLLAVLFLITGFSLVGIPPSSGFWGKFMLVQESFVQGRYAWGGLALAVGVLTLYSMVKIWLEGFWKPHPRGAALTATTLNLTPAYAVVLVLASLLLVMGLFPEPLIQYADAATAHLWRVSAP
ncbi:MAG: proton-conducting transporter membrane subunit [Gammaproteobacteria bacterium]|jgi:multicomponent Na+:H+ antiporter subunit D